MQDHDALAATIRSGKRLVIYLHDQPDPDALASGWVLMRIAESLGCEAMMVYGGGLNRAENQAVVRLLDMPAVAITGKGPRRRKDDLYAVVDTQPRAENNSFPDDRDATIVIDHHPLRPDVEGSYIDIRPDEGSCTTMLLDYYWKLGLEIDGDLATAAAYAILSETQDLEREATPADRSAYQRLVPHVRVTTLGRIRHPPRGREYYLAMGRAMLRVAVARNTVVCHIGEVPYPEVVAAVADFLVPMKGVTRCLVSGLYEKTMVVSLRATYPNAQADQVMKAILGDEGRGGGHGAIAGGALPCANEEQYMEFGRLLNERLAEIPPRTQARFRPLLEVVDEQLDESGTPVQGEGE
jgi:nanoRNase/pAp phosphatase (c-di-AMP/oligoRNAs hydrolase)